MNRLFTLILSVLCLGLSAQDFVTPPSYTIPAGELPSLTTYKAGTFNHVEIMEEDERIEATTGRYNYGRIAEESFNVLEVGQWLELEDGGQICRLKYETIGALATAVFFDEFYLPAGAELFFYNEDGSSALYPITDKDNSSHGRFVTDYVIGDAAVLEYYQPADVVGTPVLHVRGVGHYYRDVYDYTSEVGEDNRGGSDPCQVNVNCPEGDDWDPQKDAVVRMQTPDGNQLFLCTGMMINTTEGDCRQYMLTAYHCVDGISDDDLLDMQVKFNYERPNCETGSFPTNRNRIGVELLAHSDCQGGLNGSDFALCEVIDDINPDWDPFFVGWDATGDAGLSGVSIHHPSGDIKKISTYTNNLSSATWWNNGQGTGAHWRVVWAETETNWGVTEGGSSGSPIFNQNGLVVGTLTGGGSFCTDQDAPDYYGKMSYHFFNNPNDADQKLVLWLDPSDTGDLTYHGSYGPDCSTPFVHVDELEFDDIAIYPNPVDDVLNIDLSQQSIDLDNIVIYNSTGQLVESIQWKTGLNTINLAKYSAGMYYITFNTADKGQLTKKFTKQ